MMMRWVIRLLAWMQTSFILRLVGVRAERRNSYLESRFFNVPASQEHVMWFHASSVGELEMLRPIMDDVHAKGLKFGVTCFSDSACKALQSLKPIAVYSDLSPREDEWKRLFDRFKVNKLILAKYDFWPGLLHAAAVNGAPVLIVNAQMRESLTRVIKLFNFAHAKFPRLYLFPNDAAAEGELKQNLECEKNLMLAVDPRWERVARRMNHPKASSQVLLWSERISHLKHPIGVIGSAWIEDLDVILPAIKAGQDSIVIVPHDLSEENLAKIENRVEDAELNHRVVIVNEMGILVELYKMADWAFVGGGFGKGIHSVLEPAAYSLPVACGPNRYADFPETKELAGLGVLTRCENTQDFNRWLEHQPETHAASHLMATKRAGYAALLEQCIRIQ